MGDDPPEKNHTLPFVPPVFDWSAQSLYIQFQIFKTKVQFTFNGIYRNNSNEAKVGLSSTGWVTLHSNCTSILYGHYRRIRMTQTRYSHSLKIISNQLKMYIIVGICLEVCIPLNLNLKVTSWSDYVILLRTANLRSQMRSYSWHQNPKVKIHEGRW